MWNKKNPKPGETIWKDPDWLTKEIAKLRKGKYKKVRSIADIKADPRIDDFIQNYDGYGKHLVECKKGWAFENERTIEIGTIKEICDTINGYKLAKDER